MTHLIEIIAGLIAVIFIFAPHEFAHAFVAYKCGDGTAKDTSTAIKSPLSQHFPATVTFSVQGSFALFAKSLNLLIMRTI